MNTGRRFLRRVARFQAKHSSVGTDPVLPNGDFTWVAPLEDGWAAIRAEFDRVWARPEAIPAFHQISPDQQRISKGDRWKTFALYIFGQPVDENCAQCPQTARLLASLPTLQNAWFSILEPGYHIPPHRGPTRALIRCHLGLKVPTERERCWIRVGDQRCCWDEGKCLVFDDTYEHEVHNDTDEHRAVLFLDFDRPMDRLGGWFNRGVIKLICATHYVKEPLANLARWNQGLRQDP